MKKPHLYFRAYLTALLMLAAVPAEAAEVLLKGKGAPVLTPVKE